MRLPEARRPSCISSRRAAAFARASFRVRLAAAAIAAALVGSDSARAAMLDARRLDGKFMVVTSFLQRQALFEIAEHDAVAIIRIRPALFD